MLGLLFGCAPDVPVLGGEACAEPREAFVACAVDGDTLGLDDCARGERVRLLGIDAPEVAHETVPADCYGDEAAAYASDLLAGTWTGLTFDRECTDIYGRTLAWSFLDVSNDEDLAAQAMDLGILDDGDRLLVNELLARAGYARVYDESFARDVKYYDRIVAAASRAQAEGRGLWGPCE